MSTKPQAFPERVKALAGEKGMSVSHVRRSADDPNEDGTSADTFTSVMYGRIPTPGVPLLQAVARALGVDASEFTEYRLAVARDLLDQRKVGLDAAYENLQAVVAAGLLLPTEDELAADAAARMQARQQAEARRSSGRPATSTDTSPASQRPEDEAS
jgi:transcriptional regulator with XRE-family HTH domain